MKPRVIILTGGIASGKSMALAILKDLGFKVYSADDYTKDLYEGQVLARVKKEFPGVVEDGVLNRIKLRNIITTSEEKRLALNSLSHKEIIKRMKEDIQREKDSQIKVIEVPLYSEVNALINDNFNVVKLVYIQADHESKLERLAKREDISRDEAQRLIEKQVYDYKNKDLADIVIVNDSTKESLAKKLKEILGVFNEGS